MSGPAFCTCTWDAYYLNDGSHRTTLIVKSPSCPAWPHAKQYTRQPGAENGSDR